MRQQNSQYPEIRIEFTNHLMFNAVLTENEDLCIRLINAILGMSIDSIEYLSDEESIQATVDGRGARLDLLAQVDGEYIDIEMQVGSEPDIARRCRFYHSAIASRYTPKGKDYGSVVRSYVIFICMNDPLGAGLARYELATACRNNASVEIDDGAVTVLLNAQAWRQEQNRDVAGMLQYAVTGSFDGGLAEDIARAVDGKNLDRKWVRSSMGIMTYEHELAALNAELERRRIQVEAARADLATAQAEIEAAQADLAAAQAESEAVQAEAKAAQAEAAAAQAEAEAAQAEVATARAHAEAAQAEAASAHAEAASAHAENQAIRALSKKLSEEGRIDEFVSALDDDSLMESLLAEFGMAE